ncbi:hypothetical protein D6T70_06820 [Kurthia gibsonii]|uniref:AAA family ATPase n=1 Tax=Kurthia gibsonii TaxID=33946 RepID=UPI000EB24423|nr:AAA family ATPase [Kurthia gibsonii]RXH52232.1 hypothetical protein D6T70_06820 [Kurthia gibsonii]
MDKMKVEFENCYGIQKLNHIFDFSKGDTKIIYAPNGVMKSSFANTLDDYSKEKESKDRITSELQNIRHITDQFGTDIDKESIFVIKPFEQTFKTNRISTLLVNQNLKAEYDEIFQDISNELNELEKKLKKIAGINKDLVKILCESFNKKEKNFLSILLSLDEKVNIDTESIYSGIKYNAIFDPKVYSFIKTKEFEEYIYEYLKKYDELVSKSKVFKKGFNHSNAETVQKQLKDNGYFDANHSVILNIDDEKIEFDTSSELSKKFLEEQNRILEDTELKNTFNKIDKKLTNIQLKDFRDLLLERPEILAELKNLAELKQKLWISYLAENKDQFNIVVNKYKLGQEKLSHIVRRAKMESTRWEEVVSIFNSRFHVPYKVEIENKEDSIIKESTPNIKYYFGNDIEDSNKVEENLLWDILSQGEKRTLYLLNIIFEIESRKAANLETIFIVDDIADSFDYKNKYAIIEYLKDIANNSLFKMIILTHNFDFLRTVQTRICEGKHKYNSTFMALKEEDKIILEPWKFNYISNPLKNWKDNLEDEAKLIASITFARNLVDYMDDDSSFNILTSILHIKENTKNITIDDLEGIYFTIFKKFDGINLSDKNLKIYDIILKTAEKITSVGMERVNLEEKIVLSIAIRLVAEEYMIHKINDNNFVSDIKKNQTAKLFNKIQKIDNIEDEVIKILERVNIMTPENIHLNSFMFEPLLDLSNAHLIKLFMDVKNLGSNEVGEPQLLH